MQIIPVTEENQIAAVETLAREIWTEHYIPIIGEAQVEYMLDRFQSVSAIGQQMADGYSYFLVEEDDRYIGYMAIQPKGNELFLSKIYLASSERGKGHGKRCLDHVENIARYNRLHAITLTVNKNNTNSIACYESWGFEKREAIVQDIGGGFVMDDYRMHKKVR